MKKLFAILLTGMLAMSAFAPSVYGLQLIGGGPEGTQNSPMIKTDEEGQKMLPLEIYGTIIEETETSITVKDPLTESTVILNVSKDTYIVDAVTGIAATIKDRTGDRIAAFYGPATTMSIPAQSNAVAIAVNLPENNFSPKFVIVEAVNKVDNTLKITTNNGSLIITIDSENPIAPYLTRNIVTLGHIEVGTELMVWYNMVAMSFPGQTTSERTVVFGKRTGANGSATVFTNAGVAVINGEEINLEPAPYVNDQGVLMLPLRLMCEAFGYEVKWIENTSKVEITKGGSKAVVEFGSKTYAIEGRDSMIQNFTFEEAPVFNRTTNRSYVSPGFFRAVMDIEVIVNDSEM